MNQDTTKKDATKNQSEQTAAQQTALATEHAAIWAYGLISAYLAEPYTDQLAEAAATHRARRDAIERALLDVGALPVPAEPGYLIPEPVGDADSALRLAITVETDTAAAWHSVVERSPARSNLRATALNALTDAAVRATRWRAATGSTALTVPFPGQS